MSEASRTRGTPTLDAIMARRLSRRAMLRGGAAGAVGAVLGGVAGAGARTSPSLTFSEVAHGSDGTVHVPPGYRAQVVMRWGDPVVPGAPPFRVADQSAAAQARQFGYNCDFIAFMPLPLGSKSGDHGLLCVNHEYTIPYLMFPGMTRTSLARNGLDRARTDVELAAHGHSVVEVRKRGGAWQAVGDSRFNRRLTTGDTEFGVSGPAAGHARLRTRADPTGRKVRGTLNNCAGGTTPWGTVLIAEENFQAYFSGKPSGMEARNHARYGVGGEAWYPWWARHHGRFDLGKEPNEPNRFGWIVEYDPYDPSSRPIKRTALGRCKHECATTALDPDRRVVVYSGDDEIFEYLYRFHSKGRYDAEDRAANRTLLDRGTLSVARFHDDGTLDWLPLLYGSGPLTPANGFRSQAEVLIETRRAADLLGATPMDRPEDVESNPVTGRVYVALTKNPGRKPGGADAANPRGPNPSGHVLELIPPGGTRHAADRFRWEVFLLAGDPSRPRSGAAYHPDVSGDGWLAAPDNLAFDRHGRLWIATDGLPKRGLADGLYGCQVEGPERALTRHLFRAPVGAEVCGPAFTPDGRTLFVSVQHPGSNSPGFDRPSTRWPDFDAALPPRPSVVAVTREDGGEIGE